MIIMDKDGHVHSPSILLESYSKSHLNIMRKIDGMSVEEIQNERAAMGALHLIKKLQEIDDRHTESTARLKAAYNRLIFNEAQQTYKSFYSYMKQLKKYINDDDYDANGNDSISGSGRIGPNTIVGRESVEDSMLYYHYGRFVCNGSITYKIKKNKALYLKDIKLDIPANLLVLPFKEFLISTPEHTIETDRGSLMNIYIGQEEFDPESYKDHDYIIDETIKRVIDKYGNKISRIIRALAIYKTDNNDELKTFYYQMPIVDSEDVVSQVKYLLDGVENKSNRDNFETIFNFTLNFCSYLSTRDPDVEKVLGIKYKQISGRKTKPHKARQAEDKDRLYGYDHFSVGRIFDTRYMSNNKPHQGGSLEFRRYKVRAHIRAQWYGPKSTEGPRGTHQELILIDEFEKGSDLEELNPKNVQVG